MGVTHMFEILKGVDEEEIAISSLCGKTVAIDVSIWIVELKEKGKAISSKTKVEIDRNTYLFKHIFNRVVALLSSGVKLVAVFDGKAPSIKMEALQKRQSGSSSVNLDRRELEIISKQVKEMLECFSIPCIMPKQGEGEAICAHLDKQGVVDGCISKDSDYFCYGGKTFYRNFKNEGKDYVVTKYTSEKIRTKLNLEQQDLISLALLIGGDYCTGVKNVGKKKALQLVRHLKGQGHQPLDRICGWQELDTARAQSDKVKKNIHCTTCDHLGSLTDHKTNGCRVCPQNRCQESPDQSCDCAWHQQKEFQIRSQALEKPGFIDKCKQVKDEYMREFSESFNTNQQPIDPHRIVQDGIFNKMKLDRDIVAGKLITMVIHCQLRGQLTEDMFTPIRIERESKENKISCYKVLWDKTDKNTWMGKLPGTNIDRNIECQLFASRYSTMVERFLAEKNGKSKPSKPAKKRKHENDPQQSTLPKLLKKSDTSVRVLDFSGK